MSEPCSSPVLTGIEAARWLRLDEQYAAEADAVDAVKRLVRKGKLRPIAGLRPYRYTLAELERFVRDQTEAFERETVSQAEGKAAP